MADTTKYETVARLRSELLREEKRWLDTRSELGEWAVITVWELVHDRLEPVQVSVEARQGRRRVTADAIRKLPLGEMLAEGRGALTALSDLPRRYPQYAPYLDTTLLDRATKIGEPQRGTPLSNDDLEDVVQVYREARKLGRPVNAAVREAFVLSKDGAAKRISKARRMLRDRGEEL